MQQNKIKEDLQPGELGNKKLEACPYCQGKIVEECRGAKNQYDEFLHKIQQQKMKALWDNKEDEAWEKT